jgi:predicted transcriptional regulator
MIDLMTAIQSLRPNAKLVIRGDVIEWMDDIQTQPTEAEITAEILRLQAEYDSKQYQRDRAEAYPSLTEQADMAYWDRQNGTTTLDDAISAVKTTYPKPGV